MSSRARANGEGSIYPYRNGYAAYVWVTKPNGTRARKYVYGKTREVVHDKWLKLHQRASEGPVASSVPTLAKYLAYWLEEIVTPNLAPLTAATYETFVRLYLVPGLGDKRLDRRYRFGTCRRGSTVFRVPASAVSKARMLVVRRSGVAAARRPLGPVARTTRPREP